MIPSADTQKIPSADTQKIPSADTQKIPSADTQKIPSADTQKIPSADTQKIPSADTQKIPSADTQKIPSADTQKIPSADTQKIPSSDTQIPNADAACPRICKNGLPVHAAKLYVAYMQGCCRTISDIFSCWTPRFTLLTEHLSMNRNEFPNKRLFLFHSLQESIPICVNKKYKVITSSMLLLIWLCPGTYWPLGCHQKELNLKRKLTKFYKHGNLLQFYMISLKHLDEQSNSELLVNNNVDSKIVCDVTSSQFTNHGVKAILITI